MFHPQVCRCTAAPPETCLWIPLLARLAVHTKSRCTTGSQPSDPQLLDAQCLPMSPGGRADLGLMALQVQRADAEVSALLMQRNAVAAALSRLHALPPMLRDPYTCGSCSQLGLCASLHKARPDTPASP